MKACALTASAGLPACVCFSFDFHSQPNPYLVCSPLTLCALLRAAAYFPPHCAECTYLGFRFGVQWYARCNSTSVVLKAATGDIAGSIERISRCVEALERYPGLVRFPMG